MWIYRISRTLLQLLEFQSQVQPLSLGNINVQSAAQWSTSPCLLWQLTPQSCGDNLNISSSNSSTHLQEYMLNTSCIEGRQDIRHITYITSVRYRRGVKSLGSLCHFTVADIFRKKLEIKLNGSFKLFSILLYKELYLLHCRTEVSKTNKMNNLVQNCLDTHTKGSWHIQRRLYVKGTGNPGLISIKNHWALDPWL